MRNPYSVGPYVYGNQFYGRQALVQYLLDAQRTRVYLVGNRRVGKTSLLHYLAAQTSEVAFYINLQGSGTHTQQLAAQAWRTIQRALGPYARFQNVLQQMAPAAPQDFAEVIDTLGLLAQASGSPVLLLLDEAEVFLDLTSAELSRLRNVLESHQPHLRVILAATRKLAELAARESASATSPFLNEFEMVYIANLSDTEAADLICQKHSAAGQVQAEPHLIDRLRALSGNHPYLLQVLCSRVFQTDGSLRAPTNQDLGLDLQMQNYCEIEYLVLAPTERRLLEQIVRQRTPKLTTLARALRLSQAETKRFLAALELLGTLNKTTPGSYRISNVFLEEWLSAKAPRARKQPATVLVNDQVSDTVANLARAPAAPARKKNKRQKELSFEILEGAIVRILTATAQQPVGAGVLIGGKQVLTCAHVVARALNLKAIPATAPSLPVSLDFPLSTVPQVCQGHVQVWQPPTPREEGDIAILELTEELSTLQPVKLRSVTHPWGHKIRAFGFPDNHENGIWIEGCLRHFVGGRRLQIEGTNLTGHFIQPGFSGGPVWDEELGDAIGIIVSVEMSPNVRVAFVIPNNLLAHALP